MRTFIILLIMAVLGGGVYWWLQQSKENSGPVVLETALVEPGSVRQVLEATGIIKPKVGAEVKIGARATGNIRSMLVKVGDRVTHGQLVAVIDDRELLTTQKELQASLARSMAELENVKQSYPLLIQEAQAQLDAEQAKAAYANKQLARQEQLFQAKQTSRDELDAARQSAEVEEKLVKAKQITLERLRKEFVQEKLKAEKTVEASQASLEAVEIRISYTRIISPMDGVVSQVTAQEGETVVAGLQVANLITVIDPSRLEMWVYVDETDVGRIAPGLPVEFTVDAYPEVIFTGDVAEIYPKPEIKENIVYYQALVDLNPEQAVRLRPEMTTQCTIVVQAKNDVLSIPNTALKWVDGEQVVYVQTSGGEVRRTKPELGLSGLHRSEVLSGLAQGDKVAVRLVLTGEAGGGSRRPGGSGGPPR